MGNYFTFSPSSPRPPKSPPVIPWPLIAGTTVCHGQLFQNCYKSILCQEDIYLLELTRYLHLNLLRAGIVKDLGTLDTYLFTGHRVLMGHQRYPRTSPPPPPALEDGFCESSDRTCQPRLARANRSLQTTGLGLSSFNIKSIG
jgi:hypothetical protein